MQRAARGGKGYGVFAYLLLLKHLTNFAVDRKRNGGMGPREIDDELSERQLEPRPRFPLKVLYE